MNNVTCITKNNFVTDIHIEMKIQFFADVFISQVIKNYLQSLFRLFFCRFGR
jgi:hypothetical protein